MKPKRRPPQAFFIALSILLILDGIFASVYILEKTNKLVTEEHDKHIADIANEIDNSLALYLERCRSQLSYELKQDSVLAAEMEYLETGDYAHLRDELRNRTTMLSGSVRDVFVLKGDEILFGAGNQDTEDYSILAGSSDDRLLSLLDASGNLFLLAMARHSDCEFRYGFLISLDDFLLQADFESQYDSYLTLLYDEDLNLFLETEGTAHSYKSYTPEEALKLNDGHSFLVRHRNDSSCTAGFYSFPDELHALNSARMYLIPRELTKNGVFVVAVSVRSKILFSRFNALAVNQLISSFVLAFGLGVLTFLLLKNRRANVKLSESIETLRKEKQMEDAILERQKEIAHHQRLELMGQMTTGISHEFNNLLTPIMGYSMMIVENQPDDTSPTYESALEIYNAAVRAKALVSRIGKLAGKNATDSMRILSPNSLIMNILALTLSSKPKNVDIRTDLRSKSVILGNEAQLGQLLINLLVNAYQAFDGKDGRIDIETVDLEKSVLVRVADNGPGIPSEYLEKIFDPFFTTKEAGKGTGLGLAIVNQAIQDHNGTIDVDTQPGMGTAFVMTFPTAEKPEEAE